MPAEQRRDQVCGSEDVEAAGDHHAGNTVKGRGVPCDLRSVDGEMGRYGTVETLFGEDLGGICGVSGGGRGSVFFPVVS
jgi:hypothetical protein